VAALVDGRWAVRFLDSDSMHVCAVGRLGASSYSEATGPEASAGWAACVSLAARQSTRGPLPASRLSPAPSPSGRLAAVRRSRRRYRLAQKPVRDPGGGHSLSCSGLSRRPLPRSHPPSAAGGRLSLCFVMWRWRFRQQDASRDCQEFGHVWPADAGVCTSCPSTICGRRTPESELAIPLLVMRD
jgi:hypothetical protein